MTDYYGSWVRLYKSDRMFTNINIKIIPIGCMRPEYKDGWDYWVDEKGALQIRVAEFKNPDFAFYGIIHELLEAWRCMRAGIPLEAIEKFDAEHSDDDDPGRLKNAPYHKQHMQSMTIEHILCEQDGYDYDDFADAEPIDSCKSSDLSV